MISESEELAQGSAVVVVAPGEQPVHFQYRAYGQYPLLFGLGAFGIAFITAVSLGGALFRRRGKARPSPVE